MRIGTMIDSSRGVDALVEGARHAKDHGFSTAWLAQLFDVDAMAALAVVGREVPDIEIGTAVVPTYPRHPMAMASSALTTQAASGNRFVLGIGLSHQIVIEGMFGHSYDKPARHMREYLSVLLPALRGETVQFSGETLSGNILFPMTVAGAEAPPVLLAALAPRMLELAGGTAGGTITWMTGPGTVADHIVPSITKAAEGAGKPAPRVVVGLPVLVTDDPDAARANANETFAIYGTLPSYRAMLDREGAGQPGDVAIVGDEATVAKQVAALADIGTTDFLAAPFGEPDAINRTFEVLAGLQ